MAPPGDAALCPFDGSDGTMRSDLMCWCWTLPTPDQNILQVVLRPVGRSERTAVRAFVTRKSTAGESGRCRGQGLHNII
jgi:hypothetical protein